MEITNEIIIKCEKCGEIIAVSPDDFDYEISTEERGMGEEITYFYVHDFQCENCYHDIRIEVTAVEYPVGAFNYQSSTIEGAEFIEEPNVDIIYYYDYLDEDFEEFRTEVEIQIENILSNPELMYEMDSRDFEKVVESLFKSKGFSTELTQQTRDGGKDIYATKNDPLGNPLVYIIECKRYGKKNTVGVDVVRQVYGTHVAEKINKSIVVTTSKFSPDAKKFAEKQNRLIDLIDGDDLLILLASLK